jgi:hypothetical protein
MWHRHDGNWIVVKLGAQASCLQKILDTPPVQAGSLRSQGLDRSSG